MNRIKQIIAKKGIEDIRPSDAFLNRLGVKINTWNQWVANKRDPELVHLPIIAEMLECDICELIKEPELVRP